MGLFDKIVDLKVRRNSRHREHLDNRDRHRKAKRRHPKRHSENRERSQLDAKRALKAKLAGLKQRKERADFLTMARAYWRGEIDGHP